MAARPRKHIARRQIDIERAVRAAQVTAIAIGRRAASAAVSAFRDHADPAHAGLNELQGLRELLKQLYEYSVLAGRQRVFVAAGVRPREITASTNPFLTGGIEAFVKRYNLSEQELANLAERADTAAARVWDKLAADAERVLKAETTDILRSGEHLAGGAKRIREAFDRLGLTETNSYQAETIVRTQTQLGYSAGEWKAYRDPVIDDILWGFEYVTAGDDRVREAHALMDGVKLPKNHLFWKTNYPPNGYNCRCGVIPVYDDEIEVVRPAGNPIADEGFRFNPEILL